MPFPGLGHVNDDVDSHVGDKSDAIIRLSRSSSDDSWMEDAKDTLSSLKVVDYLGDTAGGELAHSLPSSASQQSGLPRLQASSLHLFTVSSHTDLLPQGSMVGTNIPDANTMLAS